MAASVGIAFGLSSHSIGSASSADFARHQVSATTATPLSFTLYDALDAGAAGDLRLVVALDLAAEHRAVLDRGAQHARQLDVDREHLAAVELVGGVEPLDRLAGDLPVARVLERDALGIRRRHLGGGRRDLAVARGALGRRMGDDAVGDGELADRDLPLVGRGLQQHHARRRAAAAHIVLRGADAAAAAGAHFAPHPLAGEVLPRRDAVGRDLLPVALELFGDELGEAGRGALAHLGAGDADHAGVVGLDDDPGIDLDALVLGGLRRAPKRRHRPACGSRARGRRRRRPWCRPRRCGGKASSCWICSS